MGLTDWGIFQSDIFDKPEPIASREQSLTRICHQNRCDARVWAQGLGYTPLSSSRSWVKCEMGELIDPRTMLFFSLVGVEFFYSWACYVTSIRRWTFFECLWTYIFIIAANMSTEPSKSWRIFSLCRCELWTIIPFIPYTQEKLQKSFYPLFGHFSLFYLSF